MSINKLSVALNGFFDSLCSLIVKDWNPGELKKELAFRDSLAKCIRQHAPSAYVEKEYRYEGTTLDLAVSWEGIVSDDRVFIELKHNLKQKTQLDRLIGQIEQIDLETNKLILVLCGETNPALADRLRRKYKKHMEVSLLMEPATLVIIEKAVGRAARA